MCPHLQLCVCVQVCVCALHFNHSVRAGPFVYTSQVLHQQIYTRCYLSHFIHGETEARGSRPAKVRQRIECTWLPGPQTCASCCVAQGGAMTRHTGGLLRPLPCLCGWFWNVGMGSRAQGRAVSGGHMHGPGRGGLPL